MRASLCCKFAVGRRDPPGRDLLHPLAVQPPMSSTGPQHPSTGRDSQGPPGGNFMTKISNSLVMFFKKTIEILTVCASAEKYFTC